MHYYTDLLLAFFAVQWPSDEKTKPGDVRGVLSKLQTFDEYDVIFIEFFSFILSFIIFFLGIRLVYTMIFFFQVKYFKCHVVTCVAFTTTNWKLTSQQYDEIWWSKVASGRDSQKKN